MLLEGKKFSARCYFLLKIKDRWKQKLLCRAGHQQRKKRATVDTDSQKQTRDRRQTRRPLGIDRHGHLTIDNQHSTTNNYLCHILYSTLDNWNQKPDNQQSTTDRKKIQQDQRWNSLTSFLVEVSGHKLESSQTWVLVSFSTLIFSFYKMPFMKRLGYLVLKSREEYGFL